MVMSYLFAGHAMHLRALALGYARTEVNKSPSLLRIKNHNRLYLWDSCVAHVVENVLCFMWQDNNAVLGVTTAHSLHRPEEDTIIRDRKRPKLTSTNARITRPIFGDLLRKQLLIPLFIDDYNHHMNG